MRYNDIQYDDVHFVLEWCDDGGHIPSRFNNTKQKTLASLIDIDYGFRWVADGSIIAKYLKDKQCFT